MFTIITSFYLTPIFINKSFELKSLKTRQYLKHNKIFVFNSEGIKKIKSLLFKLYRTYVSYKVFQMLTAQL
jgi:hypothetical protein